MVRPDLPQERDLSLPEQVLEKSLGTSASVFSLNLYLGRWRGGGGYLVYFFHSTLLFVPGLKKEKGGKEEEERHVRKMQRTDRDAERERRGWGADGK